MEEIEKMFIHIAGLVRAYFERVKKNRCYLILLLVVFYKIIITSGSARTESSR